MFTSTTVLDRENLQKKEASIQKELYELRTIVTGTQQRQRELFIEWADILEHMIELGMISLRKTEVASTMAKRMKTRGATAGEISYMYDCLPFEYKSTQEVEALHSTDDPHSNKKYVYDPSKAKRDEFFDHIRAIKDFDRSHLTPADQQEAAMLLGEIKSIQDKACEDRHLGIVDTTETHQSWQDELEAQNKFAEKYSIDKPKPKSGYTSEALHILGDVCHSIADKWEEYAGEKRDENTGDIIKPALSEEKDKEFAKSVYAFCMYLAPFHDDKWRRDWHQWYDIFKNRIDFSLHGAMSMSKRETIKKDCFRGVTREQIDAKMFDGFVFFGKLREDLPKFLPFLQALHEFYDMHQQGFLGDLTIRMREKMSFLS